MQLSKTYLKASGYMLFSKLSDLTKKHVSGNKSGQNKGYTYVDAAIGSRRAVRAFANTPVSAAVVKEILNLASRAPSGSNMQPWKVYVVTGKAKNDLSKAIINNKAKQALEKSRIWKYYPDVLPPLYKARQRKIGWDLYGLAGIKKGDHEASKQFRNNNFKFFGAPIGMIFTISNELEVGSWIDYGCFLQNIMIAARGRGLHTCPQAIFAEAPLPIREILMISEEETIVCGMALGYIDNDAAVNRLETERSSVNEFAKFIKS